jgi:TetR/AcrR family transcriptional regulator, mexJK operon transcriptional repressor
MVRTATTSKTTLTVPSLACAAMAVVGELVQTATSALPETDDVENVEKDLAELARQLITAICQPQVLRLRRLVIGEAGRFPELGRTYWERGFERGLATLADRLQRLAERGLLRLEDPQLAAHQFAGMILWVPVNRVMFCGEAGSLTPAESTATPTPAPARSSPPTAPPTTNPNE